MSLISELKRRNVFRVGIAYAVVGWLLLQITDVVVPILELPDWVARLVLLLLVLGLPLVLVFAWAYELTPEGIKREHEVDRSRSITHQTGRKLDRAIIVVLAVTLAWFAWDRFRPEPALQQTTDEVRPAPDTRADRRTETTPVVAVLPFQATGSDDGGFLATGLHDDLLTLLAKLGAYQVISRTSMMDYADTTKNMRQIGEELGASYILEGGVQARGDRVRVNAQLIHAPEDQHLWAETYSRELTAVDLFDIQAELAQAIADAMYITLSPEDRVVVDTVPTENLDAYNAYLRGLNIWATVPGVGGPHTHEAVKAFEEAVRLDPGFALAWAQLAVAHIRTTSNRYEQEASDAALAALEKARTLAPGLLEIELAWAEYQYRVLNEYADALATLQALDERVAGNTDALSLMAYLYRRLGQYEEAYRLLQSVWHLAPRAPETYYDLVSFAWMAGDCEAAGRYAAILLELQRENPNARGFVARYELECNGDARRAADLVFNGEPAQVPGFPLALIAAFSARDADLVLRVIATQWPDAGPDRPIWDQLDLHLVYTYLRPDPVLATQALDRAGALLDTYGDDPGLARDMQFARLKRFYHSARGDIDETRAWIEELRQRIQKQKKGDVFVVAYERLSDAISLAQVGLHDDAVAVLHAMLTEPGGDRFPLVDVLPVFDVLRDHPGYIELKERFGDQKN